MLHAIAPELDVDEWIGPAQSLSDLRGQVVLIETFQMLCPGCVSYGLPQAQRVRRSLPEVVVLGLHTVFEHHDAMNPRVLRAFLSEYRIGFPVGVDRHDGDSIPVTMRTYGLQGTPSTLVIDREGRLAFSAFGAVDELVLGAELGRLLSRSPHTGSAASAAAADSPAGVCEPGVGCGD